MSCQIKIEYIIDWINKAWVTGHSPERATRWKNCPLVQCCTELLWFFSGFPCKIYLDIHFLRVYFILPSSSFSEVYCILWWTVFNAFSVDSTLISSFAIKNISPAYLLKYANADIYNVRFSTLHGKNATLIGLRGNLMVTPSLYLYILWLNWNCPLFEQCINNSLNKSMVMPTS